MSSDQNFFERINGEFALSQRFKQNWHRFCGTIKLAMQLLSTNYLVGSLPRSIAFLPLLLYLTVISIISYLIIGSLTGQMNTTCKDEEDLDMIGVITSGQKYLKRNWYKVLFLMIMWGFLLAIFFANANEVHWMSSAVNVQDVRRKQLRSVQ